MKPKRSTVRVVGKRAEMANALAKICEMVEEKGDKEGAMLALQKMILYVRECRKFRLENLFGLAEEIEEDELTVLRRKERALLKERSIPTIRSEFLKGAHEVMEHLKRKKDMIAILKLKQMSFALISKSFIGGDNRERVQDRCGYDEAN